MTIEQIIIIFTLIGILFSLVLGLGVTLFYLIKDYDEQCNIFKDKIHKLETQSKELNK